MLTEAVLPVNEVLSRSPVCGKVRAEPLDTAYCLALIATYDKINVDCQMVLHEITHIHCILY